MWQLNVWLHWSGSQLWSGSISTPVLERSALCWNVRNRRVDLVWRARTCCVHCPRAQHQVYRFHDKCRISQHANGVFAWYLYHLIAAAARRDVRFSCTIPDCYRAKRHGRKCSHQYRSAQTKTLALTHRLASQLWCRQCVCAKASFLGGIVSIIFCFYVHSSCRHSTYTSPPLILLRVNWPLWTLVFIRPSGTHR